MGGGKILGDKERGLRKKVVRNLLAIKKKRKRRSTSRKQSPNGCDHRTVTDKPSRDAGTWFPGQQGLQ